MIQDPIPSHWQQLQESFTQPDYDSMLGLAAYLAAGGLLAMYVRLLYRWNGRPTSADSISRVFPMLTLVTIAVITVVKSSLALSLGLVGALSIVRFRAAIKDPEELVYLFLCIGVGLALGAEQLWLALSLVAVASLFVLVVDRVGRRTRNGDAYLTIVGSAAQHFASPGSGCLDIVRSLCPNFTLQRCDLEGDEGQLRVQLHRISDDAGPALIAKLRERLPDCQITFVNAQALL